MPYLTTDFAAPGRRRILGLLFPRTSSAASLFAVMRLMVELSGSRPVGCVSNGPRFGAWFPVLGCAQKTVFP